MRRIGTLSDPDQAKRFADYLVTLSIDCTIDTDPVGHSSDLWVRDEGAVERAKSELDAFKASPGAEKYQVGGQAERIRKEALAEDKRKKKLVQKINPKSSGVGSGAMMGLPVRQQAIPVVIAMIIMSVIASFSTEFGRPRQSKVPGEPSTAESLFYELSFVDWRDYVVSKDPLASIKKGQVWRLVTPLFLHGDTYHLAFNMMGIFFLGSAIERLQGSWFMALLLLASGIFGGLVQIWLPPEESLPPFLSGLAGSPFSIGASGAVYGLFGYLWIRPALSPSYPVRMMPANVAIMVGWLVFCIFFVDRIANGAHIGGLVAGVVIAVIVSRSATDPYS